jgi:hypothetical protein
MRELAWFHFTFFLSASFRMALSFDDDLSFAVLRISFGYEHQIISSYIFNKPPNRCSMYDSMEICNFNAAHCKLDKAI